MKIRKSFYNICIFSITFLCLVGGCGGGGGTTTDSTTQPSAQLSVPTGVSAVAGNKQVTISWNAVNEATAYNIYWSNTSGVNKTNGTKIAGVTSPYIHTALTNGTTYYYVVTAVNNSGESAESTEVSVTPTLEPPQPPG